MSSAAAAAAAAVAACAEFPGVFDLVRVKDAFCKMASERVHRLLGAYAAQEPKSWDTIKFLEGVQVSCGSMIVLKPEKVPKEPLEVWCFWTVLEILRSLHAVVLPAVLKFHLTERLGTAEQLAGAVERLLVVRHTLFHDGTPVPVETAREALSDMTTVLEVLRVPPRTGDPPAAPQLDLELFRPTPAGKEVEMPWQSLLFLHAERVLRGLENDLIRVWDKVR
jgi:hypothetical protein